MLTRLVHHDNPESRATPLLLLAALRDIDATTELVYVGDGTWWLGTVRPNAERRRSGELILQQEAQRALPNPRNVMLGHLALQGFARVQAYTCAGDPSCDHVTDAEGYMCTIVEDFRERDAHWRQDQGRSVFQHRLTASTTDPQQHHAAAQFRDYLRTDGRAHYRREVRGRVQFGPGGMTGGAGHHCSALVPPSTPGCS